MGKKRQILLIKVPFRPAERDAMGGGAMQELCFFEKYLRIWEEVTNCEQKEGRMVGGEGL